MRAVCSKANKVAEGRMIMLNKALMSVNSALYDELVPMCGKAKSKAGELLRAVNQIGYRYWNDGDMVGKDEGNETCNPAARYIASEYEDGKLGEVAKKIFWIEDYENYEELVEELVLRAVERILENPELVDQEADFSIDDCHESEDRWWRPNWWKDDEEDEEDEEVYTGPWAVYEPDERR